MTHNDHIFCPISLACYKYIYIADVFASLNSESCFDNMRRECYEVCAHVVVPSCDPPSAAKEIWQPDWSTNDQEGSGSNKIVFNILYYLLILTCFRCGDTNHRAIKNITAISPQPCDAPRGVQGKCLFCEAHFSASDVR